MGCNTKKFDQEAYLASKSTKELQALLKKSQEFVTNHPEFEYGWHNDYVQTLKLKIAERIGKK
jgi:hypothetical protein